MVIYYWAWGLPLSLICTSSEISEENIFFSFLGSYQLDLASELGLGAPVHFPSQHWNQNWQALCMLPHF